MATELETMVVAFEARTTQFVKAIEKMNKDFNKHAGATEKRAKKFETTMNTTLGRIGKAAGGVLVVQELERIARAARESVSSVAGIADTAAKVGASAAEVQEFRYALEQAGGSAQDADAGLVQWTRHLADAKNKGSDLGKILDANNIKWRDRTPLDVMRDYADLVENAASETDKMTLVIAGFGRTGAEWIQALSNGQRGLAQEAAKFRAAGGIINEAEVARIAATDDKLDHLYSVVMSKVNEELGKAAGQTLEWAENAKTLMAELENYALWRAIRDAFTASVIRPGTGGGATPVPTPATIKAATDGVTDLTAAYQKLREGMGPAPGVNTTINKRGPTKIPELGGGGADTETAYEREVAAIKEKIAVLEDEGTTVGWTAGKTAEYTAQQELLRAAQEKGAVVTAAQRAEIAQLGSAMGTATTRTETLKRNLESVQEAQKAFASEMSGAFEGLIVDGKSFNEVLADLANNLARMLLQASIAGTGPLAGLFGTASTTGGAGGLAGLLMNAGISGGVAGGGPVKAGNAYLVGEKGPELMVPRTSGTVIPNDKLRAGGGGGITVSMPININAPGADPAQLMRVSAELSQLKQDVPRQIRAGVSSVRDRRMRV